MKYDHPELLDRLAAAYVFGTLGRLPRRRFERLVRSSEAAARALRTWEMHGAALAAAVPPVQPSPAVWSEIERRTGGAPRVRPVTQRRWRDWLRPALGFAFGLLVAVGVVREQPQWVLPSDLPEHAVLPASYVGLLLDAAGKPAALASSRRHGVELSVKLLQPLVVPQGAQAVLWALPKDAAPFRLGVLRADAKQVITMAGTSEALLSAVGELAVSIEPVGATAPQPSGDFLLRGHCVKLW
ncbi:anti-sigma factor [Methyloversatilis discipulorum]|uniref:anti-sigma factor n=1 Tax=Methyloversatilis discipulorum TaxID=1119528 RepID=UPI001A5F9B73|nr:anti-sigma factor [Methyloversatilis discipulorum]MBL8466636.1 anti-sigma factor [Methyloversatilis discipulorum]